MSSSTSNRAVVAAFLTAVFTSAFLLFLVQPIISKAILPWFGGSPSVWTTCMLFFQTLLFAGYLYAHLSQKWLRPAGQAIVHALLLGWAAASLPITADPAWKPHGAGTPTWHILGLLLTSVGLPYFVLSSTGPLLQAWFSRVLPGRSVYRLYALSNAGSLLALLSFPFLIEPSLTLHMQAGVWSAVFLGFAALGATVAAISGSQKATSAATETSVDSAIESRTDVASEATSPKLFDRLWWLGLPALASLMLIATTNHVCQNVAVIPLLWVVPLALYLLTFILTFEYSRWYQPRGYAAAALVALIAVMGMDQLITGGAGIEIRWTWELSLHLAALFLLCMLCHGELVRRRPDPKHLTEFYLMISAGGALGGMFVSLLAPVVFTTFLEWKLGLVAGGLLAALILLDGPQQAAARRLLWMAPAAAMLVIGISAAPRQQSELNLSLRNFYGVTTVKERYSDRPEQHILQLYSGCIVHGIQFQSAEKRGEPTAYYGRQSGVGQTLAELADRESLRVGIVGLGVGTLATYARGGDEYKFYEINPQVVDVAKERFSFLSDAGGRADVIIGDARLTLEHQRKQSLDLLVLDAFSGDSVPTHLLTRESFQLYRRHLASNGAIAVHVSNRYLDLAPLVAALGNCCR